MFDDFNTLKSDLQEYVEVKMDIVRLHIAENLSKIFSKVASLVIIGYLLFFILLFLSVTAGFFFARRWDSYELGFLSVAVFYLVLLIAFLFLRKYLIERPIIKAMIKLMFPIFNHDEKKSWLPVCRNNFVRRF